MNRSRRGLQATLAALGAVATVAGANGVVRGAAEVSGGGPVSAAVDSEYRFYAAWYPVFGVLLLRAARAPEDEAPIVRAAAAGSLTAASGRLLSWRVRGQPNRLQQVLLGLEIVIAAVVVPWQRSVARTPRAAAAREGLLTSG
jgi:hypothetical protein